MSQTDEWRSERRSRLYHSCIDILVDQINDLTGRDVILRFGDQQFRRSRVFLDFLSMDGDEVSHATMCPTVQCPSCWCPRDLLDGTDENFPLRDTQEVYEETASERKKLLHRDGQPRHGCKQQVSNNGIYIRYVYNIPRLCIKYVIFIIKIYQIIINLTQKYTYVMYELCNSYF